MRSLLVLLLLAAPGWAAEPRIERDIPYSPPPHERRTLDVYSAPGGKDRPIVFWIHGGGWQVGDKSEVDLKPQALVDRGYVFVSTNYRFVPQVTIDVMAGDIARAIRWVHDNAQRHGGDGRRIVLAGHSAGAQLAALLATDDRYLKAEGLSLAIVKGCVPVDGDTYDVPLQIATVEQRRADIYRRKFGDEPQQRNLSPVSHVARDKGIPPFLILHVAGHPEVTMQSERLVAALREAGVPARAYAAEGKTHGTINSELGAPDDPPSRELFAFVAELLKP